MASERLQSGAEEGDILDKRETRDQGGRAMYMQGLT
jgi:hypothetical protein